MAETINSADRKVKSPEVSIRFSTPNPKEGEKILDVELTYEDGTKEEQYIPAEIWRRNHKHVQKLIVTEKGKNLVSVTVDPRWETADVDVENNNYPRRIIPSRIEVYKREKSKAKVSRDIMQDIKTELKKDDENDAQEQQ